MRFAPHTDDDVDQMLEAIGLDAVDDLFDQIPASGSAGPARSTSPRASPRWRSSPTSAALAGRNRSRRRPGLLRRRRARTTTTCPAVVWALAGRSEFYTSYTPVPARALAGRPAGAVRVPVDDLRADRPRGLERLAVRRGDRARGGGRTWRARRPGATACWSARASIRRLRRDAADLRQGSGVRARALRRSTGGRGGEPGGRPTTSRAWSSSTRTRTACSSRRGSCSRPRTRAVRARSRCSTRCRSGCSRRPGELRRRHRRGGGTAARQPPELRRPVPRRDRRRAWTTCGACPGRIVGETRRRGRADRLRPDAPGARAAHPPREGDVATSAPTRR